MDEPEHPKALRCKPLPGAADFRAWCRKRNTTPTAVAREKNLDRIQLMRVLNGQIQRVSVDFADDIFRATDGEVPVHRWRRERSRVRVVRVQHAADVQADDGRLKCGSTGEAATCPT